MAMGTRLAYAASFRFRAPQDADGMIFKEIGELLSDPAERGNETVIGECRWNGRREPIGCRRQSLGDARCNDGQARILGFGDAGKGRHDAPDRAKQADEWRDGRDDREIGQASLGADKQDAALPHHRFKHALAPLAGGSCRSADARLRRQPRKRRLVWSAGRCAPGAPRGVSASSHRGLRGSAASTRSMPG